MAEKRLASSTACLHSVAGEFVTHPIFILEDRFSCVVLILEPRHEISNNVVCATSKVSDQPAHMHSLIRAFACHLNILSLLSY